jgi:hypothetical protein
MTIDSFTIIKKLLQNDGHYLDDPRAVSIWTYENQFGNQTYAVFMRPEHDMWNSPFVKDPVLLWDHKTGLTAKGKELCKLKSRPRS